MPVRTTEAGAPRPPSRKAGHWSLSWLLMAWFCGTALLLIGLAVAVLYWSLLDHLRKDDESYLIDKIEVLRRVLASGDAVIVRSAVISDPTVRINSRVFVRILDAKGAVLLETPRFSQELGTCPFPSVANGVGSPATIARSAWIGSDGRSYRLAVGAYQCGLNGIGNIQVAFHNRPSELLLANYRTWLAAVLLTTASGCILLGYVVARRGLRPITRLTQVTSAVTMAKLDGRIDTAGFPNELASLASSINAMMERLEDAFGRLSRFSSDIAHELRTPLYNIMGMVEVSLQRERPSIEYQETLASCLEEFNRLSQLIETLLFLARAEHPETAIVREHFDLSSELERLVFFYQPAADEAGVKVIMGDLREMPMTGDRQLIQRAIGNLVENALSYTTSGGSIHISATATPEQVSILIVDNGCGIPEHHLPHVFDRLYRVDSSRSSSIHSGLGLAMVQTIVKLHGGRIQLTSSVGVDHGTQVQLVLPRLPLTKS